MIFFLWFVFSLKLVLCQKQVIQVGLLFVKNYSDLQVALGYRIAASAVLVSLDHVKTDNLLDNYDFNFTYTFDECSENLGAGGAVELILNRKVDVIFGPTCNRPAIAAATISAFYNVPIFLWGVTTSHDLMNNTRYPTTMPFSVNTYSLALAVYSMMKQFSWSEFVFLYSNDGDDEKCDSLKTDILSVVSTKQDVTLSYLYQMSAVNMDNIRTAIKAIKTRGRIIVVCLANGNGRKCALMSAAYLEDAISDEYLYIMAETNSKGFRVDDLGGTFHYLWSDNIGIQSNLTGDKAQEAFRKVLFLVDNMMQNYIVTDKYLNFSNQVIQRMSEPPFNCVEECAGSNWTHVANYAGQLADAFYAYSIAFNKSLGQGMKGVNNGTWIIDNMAMSFEGVGSGDVSVADDLSRVSEFYLVALNGSKLPQTYAKFIVRSSNVSFNPYYTDEAELFGNRDRPLSIPICGFYGTDCPVNFFKSYLILTIVVGLVILTAIFSAIFRVLYTIRIKKKEIERQDQMWHVVYSELHGIKKVKPELSQRSIASGPSTSTKLTVESKNETTRYRFYTYQNEPIAAFKHDNRVQLDAEFRTTLRKLRDSDHDNLNKFIGLCLDGHQLLSVWRYCSRGSLSDVIRNSSMQMDGFFIFSLIRDIANGLGYIHFSHLEYHGYLTSKCCLIDDRWQVKISDHGLSVIRRYDKIPSKDLLWTAPEILREGEKSKEGDIYSYAIICSEVITKKSAFDVENGKETVEEIVNRVKRDGFNPMRPFLDVDEALEINPALLHLVRDCWAERPSERPTVQQVKSLLAGMNNARKSNLMDHVFNLMETYASTLEEEVSERTKELVEEKKKSDVLLYRMLPRQVADKLKLGQGVEPETFEQVTIFFSDVVKFTNLAAKCSPFQVVTLLNELYTIFDNIIEQNDVYKVETIGDGYLCVSGLPHRNGNEHIRHIARMSLGFMSSLQYFRIAHLPDERINLRIGINCGSVVAGVVGLTMPRYCLFGDAVNTASRMESNGKPGMIHMSSDANMMLARVGGFVTESRGDVIIKGKGVMETFWLLKEIKTTQSISRDEPRTPTKTGIYSEYRLAS